MPTIYCAMILIVLGSTAVRSHGDEDEEMCFPFRRTLGLRPPAANQQGRPGKTGTPGPPGWFLNKNR